MKREFFPYFGRHPNLIYLDTAATAHKPQAVIDAITSFYNSDYATVHRAIYRPSIRATDLYHASRLAAQRFLEAAHPEEIIFTRGTTDALNLVAQSYGRTFLKPGDEIAVSPTEHHSNFVPWQMVASATGAKLHFISMDQNGNLDWRAALTPKTKIVAIAHMSNVTGTIHPIREIAIQAHAQGAIIVVDGAQAAPHCPVNVEELDVDFYAFSGHKAYGPSGIGILYGKKNLLEKMPPIQGGGDMITEVTQNSSIYQPPPLRFEAGTPILASAIALKPALDFIESIGRSAIAAHEQALLTQASDHLLRIPGLRILGQAPEKGPLLTFTIDGIHPLDLATFLDLKNVAVRSGHLCAQPAMKFFGLTTAVRASFGLYNTSNEVDRFVEALRQSVNELRD